MTTPTPDDPYDTLPPAEAVVRLWSATSQRGHDQIRELDGALARALDRLAEYERTPPDKRRPHVRSLPPLWQEPDGSDQ
jgi:hypothetical protein